jgi:hypothetical protein
MRQRLASRMSCAAPAPEIRISDDVRMMGNGSGRLLPVARSVDVPLTADSVAPSRLVYGSLDLAPDASRDDGYAAIYFTVAGDRQLGRVTFEGIDAVRAARGETLPYDINPSRTRDDWVFTVDDSPWLAERHHYEMQRYSTPLAETHQHYVFQFHDEFACLSGPSVARPRGHRKPPAGRETVAGQKRSTSITVWAKACGASCGTL